MEPVTLTATAIATIAFTKFLESSAGKAAEKFTEAAIPKMDELRKQIWAKLRGRARVEEVKATVAQSAQITQTQIDQLAAYLQVAMDEDPKSPLKKGGLQTTPESSSPLLRGLGGSV